MLTTKQAIEQRRSIRKFKSDIIPRGVLEEMIDAARLAPSNGNSQPWYFKIVTDKVFKDKLAAASFNQKFISEAPTILICAARLNDFADNIAQGAQELGANQEITLEIVEMVLSWTNSLHSASTPQLATLASLQVAIAIEHIVLRALDYGLGTCWITPNSVKVNEIFGWDQNIFVVALLPIGYPAENPKPRKRRLLREIII